MPLSAIPQDFKESIALDHFTGEWAVLGSTVVPGRRFSMAIQLVRVARVTLRGAIRS